MRALVAKDRLVEGYWTGYNASLERSVLKKVKYLEEQPVASEKPAPEPAMQPAPPTYAPQAQAPAPQAAASIFAEKLEQAWRKGS
jgi:hypothetical protein